MNNQHIQLGRWAQQTISFLQMCLDDEKKKPMPDLKVCRAFQTAINQLVEEQRKREQNLNNPWPSGAA